MKRPLLFLGLVALVTACSSGGNGPSTTVPLQSQSPKTAPQAVGSATLTIKYPTNFGRVISSSANAKAKAKPQYVNPTTTNYLDVYVNQVLVVGQNAYGNGLNYDTVQVNSNNGDGTQSISIPMYSSSSNDIVVAERDTSGETPGHLLALGQTFSTPGYGGYFQTVTLSMGMNFYEFAYSTDDTNFYALNNGCNAVGTTYTTQTLYIVPADYTGGFGGSAGSVSGIPEPQVSSVPNASASPPASVLLGTTTLGVYKLSYDSSGDQISASVTIQENPAYGVYESMPLADEDMLPAYSFGPTYYEYTVSYPNVYFQPTNGSDCGY